jgi:hypothetical protein
MTRTAATSVRVGGHKGWPGGERPERLPLRTFHICRPCSPRPAIISARASLLIMVGPWRTGPEGPGRAGMSGRVGI